MTTVRMIVRDATTGDPVSGRDVQVRTLVGDALLDTLTTDSNGLVTYTADGSPGPLVMVTDSGTTVRKTSGQNLDQVGTYYLADVPRLLSLLGDGVVAGYTDRDTAANDLALSPGTGRRINVASGAAIIDGVLQRFTGTTAVDIAENTSGATRYDLLVLDYTRFGESEEGLAELVAVTGTSASSGPSLTKSNATRQLALGLIRVVDGASSFVSGDITDLRYSPTHDQAYVQLNPNAFARSASYENGDILIVTGGKLTRLPAGTSGQALTISSGLPAWATPALTVTVQVGDSTVDAAVTTLDFDPDNFEVSSSPAGEANITIAEGGITSVELATGIPATHIGGGTVDNTEFGYLNGVTSAIQTQLTGKAAAVHTHAIADVTNLQTTLDGKSDDGHSHDAGGGLTVTQSGVEKGTDITTLDFATGFTVTETPAGEANIFVNTAVVSAVTHTHQTYPTLFAYLASNDTVQVTSSLADVETTTIGPLVSGVTYDIECQVHMRASLDSGLGYVMAYARVASDSSVSGTRTGTENGERSIMAFATKSAVVGAGASVTLSARAQMQGGGTDGSIQATTIIGRAYPRTVPAS